jgi:ATP synthase protein I
MGDTDNDRKEDRMVSVARRASNRVKAGQETPEPSLGARLGQIGVLGWAILMPILIGVVAGRWLDKAFGSGIMLTAALIMIGAAIGLWSAWKWMHSS